MGTGSHPGFGAVVFARFSTSSFAPNGLGLEVLSPNSIGSLSERWGRKSDLGSGHCLLVRREHWATARGVATQNITSLSPTLSPATFRLSLQLQPIRSRDGRKKRMSCQDTLAVPSSVNRPEARCSHSKWSWTRERRLPVHALNLREIAHSEWATIYPRSCCVSLVHSVRSRSTRASFRLMQRGTFVRPHYFGLETSSSDPPMSAPAKPWEVDAPERSRRAWRLLVQAARWAPSMARGI